MFLLIDQGNSSIKWCLCKNNKLPPSNNGNLKEFENFIQLHQCSIKQVAISSVKSEKDICTLVSVIEKYLSVVINIAASQREHVIEVGLVLKNAYTNSTQLGVDRWLVMIALWHEFEAGFIVVDAGSALTLDRVDNTGQHKGGHIIPGFSLQKKALLLDTDKVKFNEEENSAAFRLGISTAEAVHNGCLTTLCAYIETMYKKQVSTKDLPLIITGGDALKISNNTNTNHQVIHDLVLQGLYYYVKEKCDLKALNCEK